MFIPWERVGKNEQNKRLAETVSPETVQPDDPVSKGLARVRGVIRSNEENAKPTLPKAKEGLVARTRRKEHAS